MELVDPHRPAPGDVGRAIEQRLRCLARARRAREAHLDAFLVVSPELQRGVVRRIEQAAQRFLQNDRHRAHPARRIAAAASANTWAPRIMSSSLVSSDQWWLTPLRLGTNIIAERIRRDRICASWPAPLGMRRCLPGAWRSAALSISA